MNPAVAPIPGPADSGAMASVPLAPDESMLGQGWRSVFAPSPSPSDLLAPSLAEAAGSTGEPNLVDLARPALPPGPLLGSNTERMAPRRSARNPDVASNSESGHNVRIPEPWSITLVVAGVIGLAARGHLRRNLQAK